jgi:nucleotide-binding universal stress UspA family protein
MKKILAAWDGSETAAQAFEEAAELAAQTGAELHVVSVASVPDYAETVGEYKGALEDAARFFDRKLERLEGAARRHGVSYIPEVIHGHPANALIEHARRGGFDLLVVGRKGHSALERFLLGSVTLKLAAHAPCPLLIVPKRDGTSG